MDTQSVVLTRHRMALMNDTADARDLLDIARSTLLNQVLPHVPGELRYEALMIANAMAIAAREHAAGDRPARDELTRLCDLFGETGHPPHRALEAAIAHYNRRLAADIRAGRFDDKNRDALLYHLQQTSTDKVAIANPKALEDTKRG